MNRNIEVFSYQIKKERRRRTVSFVVFCICLYIFINIVISYLIYPVRQNSVSMIPDIPEKSIVLVSPVAGNFQRGDVVLLQPRYTKKLNLFLSQVQRFVSFFTAQQISIFENNEQPSCQK